MTKEVRTRPRATPTLPAETAKARRTSSGPRPASTEWRPVAARSTEVLKPIDLSGTISSTEAKMSFRGASMRVTVLLSIVALGVLALLAAPTSAQDADFLLVNGKIVTVDDRFSIAEALAVRGERIAAVGTRAEAARRKGPLTPILA